MFKNLFLLIVLVAFATSWGANKKINRTKNEFQRKEFKYLITSPRADFAESRSFCRRNGADLVQLHTAHDKQNVEDYLEWIETDESDFWIGGICDVNRGQYFWLDRTPISSTIWNDTSCRFPNERLTGIFKMLYIDLHLTGGIATTPRRAICERQ